jgi:hypothetical protein
MIARALRVDVLPEIVRVSDATRPRRVRSKSVVAIATSISGRDARSRMEQVAGGRQGRAPEADRMAAQPRCGRVRHGLRRLVHVCRTNSKPEATNRPVSLGAKRHDGGGGIRSQFPRIIPASDRKAAQVGASARPGWPTMCGKWSRRLGAVQASPGRRAGHQSAAA